MSFSCSFNPERAFWFFLTEVFLKEPLIRFNNNLEGPYEKLAFKVNPDISKE